MSNLKLTTWLHDLHEVTGTLVIYWTKDVPERERQRMTVILRGVLAEMEDPKNWDQE